MGEGKPGFHWSNLFKFLPAILLATVPRLACPCALTAYGTLFTSLGLAFLMESVYLFPLTAMFLTFAVVSMSVKAQRRHGYGPFFRRACDRDRVVGLQVLFCESSRYLWFGRGTSWRVDLERMASRQKEGSLYSRRKRRSGRAVVGAYSVVQLGQSLLPIASDTMLRSLTFVCPTGQRLSAFKMVS